MAFLNRRIDPMPFLPSKKKKKKYISLCRGEEKESFVSGRNERTILGERIYSLSKSTRYTWKTGGRSIEGEIDRYRYPSQGRKENLFREWKSILFRNLSVGKAIFRTVERLLCVYRTRPLLVSPYSSRQILTKYLVKSF